MTIDDKTRELLLKARKKADSGFGVANWAAVLRAIGFEFTIAHKDRQQILKVRVTAPNGAILTIHKDPGHKKISFGHVGLPKKGHGKKVVNDVLLGCICGAEHWPCCRLTYTSLTRWAAEQGYPIHDLAARALGMPTVEEERALKEYRERDWTHTGTCGVCCQNVKMEALGQRAVLVLHGYQRPGDGQAHGECFGRGYPPHELSPNAARDWLNRVLIPQRDRVRDELDALKSGQVRQICIREADPRRGREAEYITPGNPAWNHHLNIAIHNFENALRHAARDVTEFTAKVEGWKPAELPEVVMARRFGKDA